MSRICAGLFGAAIKVAIVLMPPAAAAEDIGALPAYYDCLFQPLVGGQLVDGVVLSPDSGQFAHLPVAIRFTVKDPSTGAATMKVGTKQGRTVPARLDVLDRVARFSYEFPGLSAGAVTISRVGGRDGFPAVRSDQGWYDGILSVGYSVGLCQSDRAG
jgi:hypothetical protein